MTTPLGTTAPTRPGLSARNKAGLILAILLGLSELANVNDGSNNPHNALRWRSRWPVPCSAPLS